MTLSAEYYRQSRKSSAEAALVEERWNQTESRIQELEFLTEKQRTEIRELTRLIYAQHSSQPKAQVQQQQPSAAGEKPIASKHVLSNAIDESLQKLNLTK